MDTINSKRLLFVTSKPIYPIDGGDKLRAYMFVKQLSASYKVIVVCPGSIEHELSNVEFHSFTSRHLLLPFRFLDLFIKRLPLQLAMLDYQRARSLVKKLYEQNDIVIGHLYRGFFLIPPSLRSKSFFEACDNFYLAAKRIKFPKSLKSFVFKVDQNSVRKLERHFIDISIGVSYINKEDAEFYDVQDFLLISNGITDHSGEMLWSHLNKTLLFIGNMNTVPNRDAIDLFLKNNTTFLKSNGLKLRVAGLGANRYNQYDVVESIESFEDYNSIGRDVLCGIAPMVNGVGVQNKVLDYLVMALPALITDVAKSGLDLVDNVNCIVVDEHNIQDRIGDLMKSKNEGYFNRLRKSGRELVLSKNSWSIEVNKLENFLEKVKY